MITYSAPASLSIAGADLAGERALRAPSAGSAPATPTFELRAASATGMQRGERRRDDDLDVVDVLDQRCGIPSTNATASWTVLYIFQLPAMNGVRMADPRLQRATCYERESSERHGVWQRRHARQLTAAEEFERRAAAGRDVRDAVGDAGLRRPRRPSRRRR